MSQVGLQFHAAPAELLGLALEWATRWHLTPVIVQLFPEFRARLHVEGEAQRVSDRTHFVALCQANPQLSAASWADFLTKNVGTFYVEVGCLEPEGLREAAMGGVSDDPSSLKLWRSIIRHAKARMHTGAIARNQSAEQLLPHHRHTPGAHDLASKGVEMLAAAGWVKYVFADVQPVTAHVTFADAD